MKKKILALLMGTMMAVAMVGCSDKTEAEPASAPAQESSAAAESTAEASTVEESSVAEGTTEEASTAEGTEAAQGTADQMAVADYLAEVEGLNTAAGDFMAVLLEILEDYENAGDKLDEIRFSLQPFYEFGEIAPPAGYEDAHAELSASAQAFAEIIDEYVDAMAAVIDGSIDTDTYTQKITELETKLNESMIAVAEDMTAIETIAQQAE